MPPRRGKPESSSTSRLLRELETRTEQLALINGVLRTIVSGAPLPDILRVFASNLKTICPFDRCSISIYDDGQNVFHVPYMVMGGRVQETKEAPRPFASTPLSEAIRTGRPVVRRDIRSEQKHFDADGAFTKKGFGCEMLVPLQVGPKPFGTFNIGAFEADRLTDDHLRAVAEIIPAIAVAVWQHMRPQRAVR